MDKINYINEVKFSGSFPRVNDAPAGNLPEYAFIGRSNVGKSSLINMLTNKRNLARTSSTPGKTQLLNYYYVDDSWYLVDLPGYGYAKASKTSRQKWERLIRDFMVKRSNLVVAFVLIDSRLPPQQKDLDFLNFLGEMRVPFVLVFTKIDKLSKGQVTQNIDAFKQKMLETWSAIPQMFLTSATQQTGRQDILTFIKEMNEKIPR